MSKLKLKPDVPVQQKTPMEKQQAKNKGQEGTSKDRHWEEAVD